MTYEMPERLEWKWDEDCHEYLAETPIGSYTANLRGDGFWSVRFYPAPGTCISVAKVEHDDDDQFALKPKQVAEEHHRSRLAAALVPSEDKGLREALEKEVAACHEELEGIYETITRSEEPEHEPLVDAVSASLGRYGVTFARAALASPPQPAGGEIEEAVVALMGVVHDFNEIAIDDDGAESNIRSILESLKGE